VKVELKVNETRDVLNAVVSDNGVGFDVDTASPGIGLVGMRERAHGAGGTISFKVLPGCGTSVEISLPLNPP
jgi:signal transduction histidine kinase